jgi:1,4-dihydroxy-2-naphthoate octaprenyltransferase
MSFTLSPTAAPGRLGAFARLAKLDVWDYYLAVPVAWAAAGPALWADPAVLATLALFLLGLVGVVAGSVALDDVTGYRDGSDRANYAAAPSARKLARKPLLTGELVERDAVVFAWGAVVVGAAFWLAALAVAPATPLWTLVMMAVCLLSAVQYSWGLRISYRGWQEVFLWGFGFGLVLSAVGLTGAVVTGFTVTVAVLFGLGPLLLGVYSNTRDARGDASVGRLTVATVLSPAGNKAFIVTLTLLELGIIVTTAGVGVGPWWFALAMLPAVALRVGQLRRGIGLGDILGARVLGLHAHRTTAALLSVVCLFAPVVGGRL